VLKDCTVDDMNVAAERFLAGIRRTRGADQVRPGVGDRLDRRGQRAALRAERR